MTLHATNTQNLPSVRLPTPGLAMGKNIHSYQLWSTARTSRNYKGSLAFCSQRLPHSCPVYVRSVGSHSIHRNAKRLRSATGTPPPVPRLSAPPKYLRRPRYKENKSGYPFYFRLYLHIVSLKEKS